MAADLSFAGVYAPRAILAACVVLGGLLTGRVSAQEVAAPAAETHAASLIDGPTLRKEISGNTVTGVHDNGMRFSEFHSPDGRVFGHNNGEPVDKGCWDVKGDAICYYYSGGSIQGTFCWDFVRAGAGYALHLPRTGTRAVAILQPGNPHNFSDNGKPWTCEPLMSRVTPDGRKRLADARRAAR
jgi:hypothetical protein